MKILMGIFLIISVGCIKQKPLAPISTGYSVDAQFEPFLSVFKMEASKYGKAVDLSKLNMHFDNSLEESTAGECENYKGRHDLGLKIKINPNLFVYPFDVTNRERVIFHELAHCLYDRDHTNKTVLTTDGYKIKASIMAESGSNDSNYERNRNSYIHELFTNEVLQGQYTLIKQSEFPYELYKTMGVE